MATRRSQPLRAQGQTKSQVRGGGDRSSTPLSASRASRLLRGVLKRLEPGGAGRVVQVVGPAAAGQFVLAGAQPVLAEQVVQVGERRECAMLGGVTGSQLADDHR